MPLPLRAEVAAAEPGPRSAILADLDPGTLASGAGRARRRPAGRHGCALLCLLALAWSGTGSATATAARDNQQVAGWGIADGLPQGTVTDILETPDGGLWLATFGGLVRFDGVRFEVFDLASLAGLPSNRITALAADAAGGLWLATQTGHLAHFSGGRVVAVIPPPKRRLELVALAISSRGAIYARGAGGEVYRVTGEALREIAAPGTGDGFHNLQATPDGGIWAGSANRLLRIDTGQEFALGGAVFDLAADGDRGLWLGLEDGLAHFAAGRMERIAVTPALAGPVSAILPDGDRLWLGTSHGATEVRRDATGAWHQVGAPITLREGYGVRSILRDHEGTVWIGSNGQGLFRLTTPRIAVRRATTGPTSVTAVVPDAAGGVWFTAGCSGLFHSDADGATVAVPVAAPGESFGCEHALALDARRRLFVRARQRLYVLPAAESGRTVPPAALPAETLPVELPAEPGLLVPDPDGTLWIVSRSGRIERLAGDRRLSLVTDLATELQSAVLAPDGTLWCGGRGEVFGLRGGRVERYGLDANVPLGAVRALLPRPGGGLLIGTYGGGAGLLRDGRVTRISTEQGLIDNAVSGFVEDRRGRVWILSNRGLSALAAGELERLDAAGHLHLLPVVLGSERGVPEGNFGSPAAALAEDDRLWFTTIEGAVSLDSAAFPWNRIPPRVRIEGVQVDDAWLPFSPKVEVPAATARVRIDFTSFARIAPQRVQFRARLQGIDRDWVEIGDRRSSVWTPSRPGEVRFEVEARNEDGIWSAEPAGIVLEVLPAWWQTTPFRLAALAATVMTLLGLHRLRLGGLRRRNRALRLEMEERRRAEGEAARLRRELEHVTRIATAGELATSLAHEVNQPLAAIVSNAEAGRRFLHLGEAVRSELEAIFGDIARQGQRASEVIQRLRAFLSKEPPQRRALDLNEVVRLVLPLVRREIEERRIRLLLDFSELPPVLGDRVQLQQVVVNLIQNACEALREAPGARRLLLRSRLAGSQVELAVEDSGPGVAAEVAATLFDPFVSTKGGGMGMGLSICRSLVESHGGTLVQESAAEGGARFVLRLPVASGAGGIA